jgi:hypothetical protein
LESNTRAGKLTVFTHWAAVDNHRFVGSNSHFLLAQGCQVARQGKVRKNKSNEENKNVCIVLDFLAQIESSWRVLFDLKSDWEEKIRSIFFLIRRLVSR